jgi:hypothetical protein
MDGLAFLNMAEGGMRFLRRRLMTIAARMAKAIRRKAAMTPPAMAPALDGRREAFCGTELGEAALEVEDGSSGKREEDERTMGTLAPGIRDVLGARGYAVLLKPPGIEGSNGGLTGGLT